MCHVSKPSRELQLLEQCSICGISEDNLEDGKCEYCLNKRSGQCSACSLYWTDMFSDGLCMKCWEVKKSGCLHIFDRDSSLWTERYVNEKLQNKKRLKTSALYWAFCITITLSVLFVVISPNMVSITVVTLSVSCAPVLLIYPILRYFAGGEDGLKVFNLALLFTVILNIFLRKKLLDLDKKK